MNQILDFLNHYSTPIATFTSVYVGLVFIQFILKHTVAKAVKRTKIEWDDVIINFFTSFGTVFKLALALYVSLFYLHIETIITKYLSLFVFIILAKNITTSLSDLVDYFIRNQIPSTKKLDRGTQDLVGKVFSFILWTVAIIFVLQNIGVNVSSILGGLGVAGIAIAFALQNILEDVFAYFTIHTDRPFKPGDFIVTGTESGTIKKVGIKSTRLNTLQGDELIINNKALVNSSIHNYKRMKERRIAFNLGVSYETSPKQLRWLKKFLVDLIDSIDLARPERVHFSAFGDSAIMFEITYYIETGDYETKMDIQEEINLSILEELNKKKIEIAYPTQTVYVKK